MTALALVPDIRIGYQPAAAAGVDRAIRVSTEVVLHRGGRRGVFLVLARLRRSPGAETGATARLESATTDGLVDASSMVNLHAARHRLPLTILACWLLAVGIVATLATNMAQGWSKGPVGPVKPITCSSPVRDPLPRQKEEEALLRQTVPGFPSGNALSVDTGVPLFAAGCMT